MTSRKQPSFEDELIARTVSMCVESDEMTREAHKSTKEAALEQALELLARIKVLEDRITLLEGQVEHLTLNCVFKNEGKSTSEVQA